MSATDGGQKDIVSVEASPSATEIEGQQHVPLVNRDGGRVESASFACRLEASGAPLGRKKAPTIEIDAHVRAKDRDVPDVGTQTIEAQANVDARHLEQARHPEIVQREAGRRCGFQRAEGHVDAGDALQRRGQSSESGAIRQVHAVEHQRDAEQREQRPQMQAVSRLRRRWS